MNVTKRKVALATLFFLSVVASQAGTPIETKAVEQASIQPTEPWHITVGAPGWLTFVWGTVGIDGVKAHVDVGPLDILRRTDFIASLRGEVSKGRFGVQGEFLYLDASDGVFTSGLVSKLDLRLEQFIGDFGVSYRIIQGPRGWLDFRAGFRYTNLDQELTVHPNDQAIDTHFTLLPKPMLAVLEWDLISPRRYQPQSVARLHATSFPRSVITTYIPITTPTACSTRSHWWPRNYLWHYFLRPVGAGFSHLRTMTKAEI